MYYRILTNNTILDDIDDDKFNTKDEAVAALKAHNEKQSNTLAFEVIEFNPGKGFKSVYNIHTNDSYTIHAVYQDERETVYENVAKVYLDSYLETIKKDADVDMIAITEPDAIDSEGQVVDIYHKENGIWVSE